VARKRRERGDMEEAMRSLFFLLLWFTVIVFGFIGCMIGIFWLAFGHGPL
jgi:hypothetical protein